MSESNERCQTVPTLSSHPIVIGHSDFFVFYILIFSFKNKDSPYLLTVPKQTQCHCYGNVTCRAIAFFSLKIFI